MMISKENLIKISATKYLIILVLTLDYAFSLQSQEVIINYNNQSLLVDNNEVYHRHGRLFETWPFYTIGRFSRQLCQGRNNLLGTCMVKGECLDTGGIVSANCTGLTANNLAICCIYQFACGTSTTVNNTYFFNPGYPLTYGGGPTCSYSVKRCNSNICQLRIDMLDFQIAQPSGNGYCNVDYMDISGGSSKVFRICGENTGQHIYVDFNEDAPIIIRFFTSSNSIFNRRWYLRMSQINCDGAFKAPSGCLQYYLEETGTVKSLNYANGANSNLNTIGVEGSRQLAMAKYGICVRAAKEACTITWSQVSNDPYSFTITDDVGSVDQGVLGTSVVQSQDCTTDYVIIPNPSQEDEMLPSDRFCGLGLAETVSNAQPFVIYHITDDDETSDIGNRGFYLSYEQNMCTVPLF